MHTHDAIRHYLAELESALRGADPALIHDAIIEARAHLTEAIINGSSAEDAIRAYGEPSEIAKAYLVAEATSPVRKPAAGAVATAPTASAAATQGKRPLSQIPFVGVWFDPIAWGSYVLMTFGSVVSTVAGIWAYSLLGVSVFTLPFLIGIPCFVLLLASVRGISLLLGRMIETLVGVRMPHRVKPVDIYGAGGFFRLIGCWFTDAGSWLTLAFILANVWVTLPLAMALGSFTCAGASTILFGLGLGSLKLTIELPERLETFLHTFGGHIFAVIIGFLSLTTVLWLSKGIAFGYAHLVKAIQIARPTAQ